MGWWEFSQPGPSRNQSLRQGWRCWSFIWDVPPEGIRWGRERRQAQRDRLPCDVLLLLSDYCFAKLHREIAGCSPKAVFPQMGKVAKRNHTSEERKQASGSLPFPVPISQGLCHRKLLPCTTGLLPMALRQISTVWISSRSGSGQVTRWVVQVLRKRKRALAGVAQLVRAKARTLIGRQFDSRSGNMPKLQVWSPVGHVLEATDQCFFLSLSLPLPLSQKMKIT